MAVSVTYVDTFQTRVSQSFVNLTKLNSSLYPAVTTSQIEYNDTGMAAVTAYFIYDQWALRTYNVSVP